MNATQKKLTLKSLRKRIAIAKKQNRFNPDNKNLRGDLRDIELKYKKFLRQQ